ncbi:hypothetical protein L218DRAFT_165630 [Marasmius fiardii PR-910]|nr:hypothetical protein L218DRAFT_165630 [Marasmius fiardii PR-910]
MVSSCCGEKANGSSDGRYRSSRPRTSTEFRIPRTGQNAAGLCVYETVLVVGVLYLVKYRTDFGRSVLP